MNYRSYNYCLLCWSALARTPSRDLLASSLNYFCIESLNKTLVCHGGTTMSRRRLSRIAQSASIITKVRDNIREVFAIQRMLNTRKRVGQLFYGRSAKYREEGIVVKLFFEESRNGGCQRIRAVREKQVDVQDGGRAFHVDGHTRTRAYTHKYNCPGGCRRRGKRRKE